MLRDCYGGDWLLHEDGDHYKKVIPRIHRDGFYFDSLEISAWNPEHDGFALIYPLSR